MSDDRVDRDLTSLRPGQTRVVDGKLWARCRDCHKIGRIDGWLGGLHWCIDLGGPDGGMAHV